MRLLSFVFAGCIGISALSAQAQEENSRLLNLARRVAAMENSRHLPSRAVWLSNRVVLNQRALAFQSIDPKGKKPKKPAPSLKN